MQYKIIYNEVNYSFMFNYFEIKIIFRKSIQW